MKHFQSKKNLRLRRIFWKNIKGIFSFGLIAILLGGIGYFGVNKVLTIKNRTLLNQDDIFSLERSKGEVLGISDVPSFPDSSFLFENNIDSDIVQQFLSQGRSAYLLPLSAQWDDVVTFYNDALERKGWKHVLSVDLSDETRMFGEYWVNGKKGLRIYTKLDDIWYELITIEQARTGLSDKIAKEQEIQMFLAMNSGESLPEKLPWKLEYSAEWASTIGKSKLLDIEFIQFDNSEGEQTLIIEPIEFVTQQPLRDVGVTYLEEANKFRGKDDQFKVSSIDPEKVAGQEAYTFILESSEADGYYCVVANPQNDVIYVIRTFTGSASFFNYVLDNIEVNDKED